MELTDMTEELVRQAQRLNNVGLHDRAFVLLTRAHCLTHDGLEHTEAADLLPRIYHRLAQTLGLKGKVQEADYLFTHAATSFSISNHIGRAITLRDHGWMLYRFSDEERGAELLERALSELEQIHPRDENEHTEYLITRGMLARTYRSACPEAAYQQMRELDDTIAELSSRNVEALDNLAYMMGMSPIHSQPSIIVRMLALKARIVVKAELAIVEDEVLQGDVVGAFAGLSWRSLKRVIPTL